MNLFEDYGYKSAEITEKVSHAWHTLFLGKPTERIFFEAAPDMGYVLDTGNNDVRTEGMGFGMMVSVQLDKKEVFNRLWKWVKTYMEIPEGNAKGFFYWSCTTDGSPIVETPRADGEQYIAMALLFAAHRWGNGKGIFNYEKEALKLLHNMLHSSHPLWNTKNHLVRGDFDADYSDPSYNMPHFYELFAMFANIKDSGFWNNAASASRAYIVQSCDPKTGMSAEFAQYDGRPLPLNQHGTFFSQSYRVLSNIGLYSMWFGDNPDLSLIAQRLVAFFDGKAVQEFMDYKIDGTPRKRRARHPVGLCATLAEAALAIERRRDPISPKTRAQAKRAVKRFWETPLRTGKRRYYDNCLYLSALLALSGNYKVY